VATVSACFSFPAPGTWPHSPENSFSPTPSLLTFGWPLHSPLPGRSQVPILFWL
jgi:hypothetical protein